MDNLKTKILSISMTWKQTIIFAVVTGVLTGILAQIPILYNTSFADITVSFEWWILFAMLIVIGQDTWWKAGFKTLVFFLISQTVVFLAEWAIAGEFYFPYWVRWIEISFLTLPAGIVAWFTRKDNIPGNVFLALPLCLLMSLGVLYTTLFVQNPPYHLLTCIFCFLQVIFWLYVLRNDWKNRAIVFAIALPLTLLNCYVLTYPIV